jgi:hypothetical protein
MVIYIYIHSVPSEHSITREHILSLKNTFYLIVLALGKHDGSQEMVRCLGFRV